MNEVRHALVSASETTFFKDLDEAVDPARGEDGVIFQAVELLNHESEELFDPFQEIASVCGRVSDTPFKEGHSGSPIVEVSERAGDWNAVTNRNESERRQLVRR